MDTPPTIRQTIDDQEKIINEYLGCVYESRMLCFESRRIIYIQGSSSWSFNKTKSLKNPSRDFFRNSQRPNFTP
jgi:hypothetical protein